MSSLKQTDFFQSTSSQEDILANLSPLQVEKKVRKIRDTSGQSILDLSKSSGRLGLLERMLVDTLNSVSTPYLRTWRVKVTPSGRLVFQLLPSVPTTKEKESGLWQTPTAVGIKERSPEALERKMKKRKEIGRSTVPPGSLMEQIQFSPNKDQKPKWNMWRTPDAHCDRGPSSEERMKKKLDKGMPISLNDQVKHPNLMWPTPRARDYKDGESVPPSRVKKPSLATLGQSVRMWPTPRAALGMSMRLTENMAKLRHKKYLETEVAYHEHKNKLWPTPSANEDAAGRPGGKMQKMLGNHPQVRGTGGGTLNPTWVEWLMGYPLGHTDLKD